MKKTIAGLALGILLFGLSNGRWTVPVLAWIAPVFLLFSIRRQRSAAALLGTLGLFVGAARVMLHGIIPPELGLFGWLLTLYYGIVWFLPYLMDRLLAAPSADFLSTLVFPCAAVAVDYLNASAFGNWGSFALTQVDNLQFLQAASVAGLWGITFLVGWFGPVALWAWENRLEWAKVRRGAALFFGVLVSVSIFGGLRLALEPRTQRTVRVASLHLGDREMRALSRGPDANDAAAGTGEIGLQARGEAMSRYFEKTRDCARRGAALVFWPEGALAIAPEEEREFLERASLAARESGTYFMPAYHLEPSADGRIRGANKCVMFEPSGRRAWTYVKAHPVPGSPDEAGSGRIPVIATPFGRVATAICYDMDFPALLRQAGRGRADIVLVPAWDWKAIDPLHARMAVFRAVENGFSMVRHTGDGLSLAVDPMGRTLASLDAYRTPDRIMTADVPTRGIRTVYRSVGDFPAWLSLAAPACFAFRAFFRRRRPRSRVKTNSGP